MRGRGRACGCARGGGAVLWPGTDGLPALRGQGDRNRCNNHTKSAFADYRRGCGRGTWCAPLTLWVARAGGWTRCGVGGDDWMPASSPRRRTFRSSSGGFQPAAFRPPAVGTRRSGGVRRGHRRSVPMAAWGSAKADFGPLPPRFQPPGTCCRSVRCVRDARPEGRDGGGAHAMNRRPGGGGARRRWPGAVGHGGIVPYRARSPARSAAEGHAQTPLAVQQLRTLQPAP